MYPWDVLDEGPQDALRQARDLAGVDAVNLAVTYHAGFFLLPHNPKQRLYAAEDGVVYFRPDLARFADGPTPTPSVLTSDRDPLAEGLVAARETGLGLRAWTVCCHNSRIGLAHPELSVRNALGDRLPFSLCPAQPRVQRYLEALVDALASYPDLEAIELEALYWQSAEHAWHHAKFGLALDPQAWFLLGLCCCEACLERAGVKLEHVAPAIQERLIAALHGQALGNATRQTISAISPHMTALLEAREHTLTRLLENLVARAHVPVRAIIGSGLVEHPWQRGIDPTAWARAAREITVNAYASTGDGVAAALGAFRRASPNSRLVVGLNATYPTTASEASLREQALAAMENRPSELSFYHYGLLSLERLGWVMRAGGAARAAGDKTILDD